MVFFDTYKIEKKYKTTQEAKAALKAIEYKLQQENTVYVETHNSIAADTGQKWYF